MATVLPFRAFRPRPEFASEVASVPYDVINTQEARALADGLPNSFLHVIRPEIDLPVGTDEHADEVYETGRKNLDRLSETVLEQETEPALYVYRLIMNGRPQHGIFGLVSTAEYDNNIILKHEKTRPDKEDDRTRHISTQRAHAEPVMLTYRGDDAINAIVAETTTGDPLYDFMAIDGVQHTIWRISKSEALSVAFGDVPLLYVADGHHRSAAASRISKEFPDVTGAQHFMAVLFPVEEMLIIPYNRVIYKLPDGPEAFLNDLRERFEVTEGVSASPLSSGRVSVYLGGRWYNVILPDGMGARASDQLDVARLQAHILDSMLGISDPRRDANIGFVGGIRGTDELERLVDSGKAEVAFSMFATTPQELLDVSDAGELMPPKSTWFEPKLRSGLLIHRF